MCCFWIAAYNLVKPAYSSLPQTRMGWDILPKALGDILREIRCYTALPVYITENSSCWQDCLQEGKVHDQDRIEYLLAHLKQVETLNAEGMNIAAYYAWSLLDNFEWAFGNTRRFGLVYVDFENGRRTPKDSYYAYKRYIQEKKVPEKVLQNSDAHR